MDIGDWFAMIAAVASLGLIIFYIIQNIQLRENRFAEYMLEIDRATLQYPKLLCVIDDENKLNEYLTDDQSNYAERLNAFLYMHLNIYEDIINQTEITNIIFFGHNRERTLWKKYLRQVFHTQYARNFWERQEVQAAYDAKLVNRINNIINEE